MSLRRVDKLVREQKYELALKILLEVRASQPNNPYLPAYEERLRSAIDIRKGGGQEMMGEAGPASGDSLVGCLPSIEEQVGTIARPVRPAPDPKAEKRALEQRKREEQRRVALLSKIASLVGNANEFLQKGQFDRALEEIARANMLDPGNGEIAHLEQRIRSTQRESERVAEEQRRLTLQREQEEREQRLRHEREEALREAEERRTRQEEARRAAQEQKVKICLKRSREFLSSGLLDEAQAELAFALVLAPDNKEASDLEGELTRSYEERHRAEIARQREEEEERRREEERIRLAVTTAVRDAEEASRRGDFARALARITEAYVDDPGNAALVACETQILAAREEWTRKQKEEAQAVEEAQRKAREEEDQRRQDEERRRVREEREEQARAQQKEQEEQLWYHLRRARTLLTNQKHDQALAEVALAFVVNPFSEDVKALEAEILLAQGAALLQRETAVESEPETDQDDSSPDAAVGEVRAILERATIHGTRREFAEAFEEIARAYALVPMDSAIAECEKRIQTAFVKFQEGLATPPPAKSPDRSAANASTRRPVNGKSERRGRSRMAEQLHPAPAPSLRAAAPRPRGGSRVLRLVMTAATLGAVSMSAAYLVNSSSTTVSPPDKQAETEATVKQSPAPAARDVPPPTQRRPVLAPAREPSAMAQEEASERRTSVLSEAGFSPVSGLSDEPERLPQANTISQESTSVESPSNPTLVTVHDSVSASPVDSIAEEPGDLYASSPLPGSSLTQAPQILRLSRPQLTDVSRRSETPEEITVMVEIGADGVPQQARVVRSTYPPYNHAVIDAVMRSEFQAGLTPSGPAAKWMTIPFRIKP